MSDNIERQRELSRRVLTSDAPKPLEQKASGRIQLAPLQFIYPFILGAISGLALFALIWILTGFSKLALMLSFVGGPIGIAIEIIRRKNKASAQGDSL
ncbi:MAG: hypothetical protein HUU08_06400 [Candidatus Brocadia sp.]|nr:hypothetical protein [Candidatus Brocadia sp.]